MIKEVKLPNLYEILNGIPHEDLPKDMTTFWRAMAHELADMMNAASHAREGQIVLNPFRKSGDQYVWEFFVNDLAKENVPTKINWHGQNTSQWLYAGCILLDNGKVSLHH